jgi:DNA-binding NarL/FixJ family response regulator
MSGQTTQTRSIRVLIANGNLLVCRALERLLRDAKDVEVVAMATTELLTLELAGQLQPSVALLDVGNARRDGMALTRKLRQQTPAMQIVVLSVYESFRDQALTDGACHFLLKDCSRVELVAAVRLAAHGQCQG